MPESQYHNTTSSNNKNDDACLPTVVTDWIFDLFDSVTLSHVPEEQTALYHTVTNDLHQKYFSQGHWPSTMAIAKECNGDPLFLAIYRELAHRHSFAPRPNLQDRMEGWDVYRDLLDELLEAGDDFYLLPSWTFDVLHEFVYQFQGYCQIRTAIYAAAHKHQILENMGADGDVSNKHGQLVENITILQNNPDTWDVEAVYQYLHRLIAKGLEHSGQNGKPVWTYFALFGSIALSRLECLVGDYTGCLQALDVLTLHANTSVPDTNSADGATATTTTKQTWMELLHTVWAARISLSYHAGIAYLQLRRYQDAAHVLTDCAGALQRGFKTGALQGRSNNRNDNNNNNDKNNNKQNQQLQSGNDQFPKQYDRIVSVVALLQQICPGFSHHSEEAVLRAVRDKHASKIQGSLNLEEWFQSPKFICPATVPWMNDNGGNKVLSSTLLHRHQMDVFAREMKYSLYGRTLRSYLKLYTSLPVQKLAQFQDLTEEHQALALLWSYKYRMRQMERDPTAADTNNKDQESTSQEQQYTMMSNGTFQSTALDIHYYIDETNTVHVDEAEMQRRFETYFCGQILQNCDIRNDARAVDMTI